MGTVSLSHFITSLLSLSKKYSITWSSGLILVAKTISQIDSIAFQFGLKISAIELIRPELESQITQCFSKKVTKEMIFRETLELIEAGKNLPESVAELEKLVGDDLKLQVDGRLINQKNLSPIDTILVLVVSIVGTYFLMQILPIAESQYKNVFMIGFPLLLYFVIGRIIRS